MSEQAMQEAEMVEAAAERTGVPRDEISRHLWQVMTGYVIHTGLEGEDTAIAWVRTTTRDAVNARNAFHRTLLMGCIIPTQGCIGAVG